MRKIIMNRVLMMIALVAGLGLVVGSGGCRSVPTYTDPGQQMKVRVGQEFVIALESNITTGYSWQESHDEALVELVGNTYKQSQHSQGLVGAGGTEYFRFKALSSGRAEITLNYKRPWEEEIAETKVFTVDIK
ncbi:MAG: protease inhibitor I42 family protein [Dehalococcoidales bacterium]|nr:protease inhibitor I42 family protein [Dehalococcoidales bacterium]